MNLAQRVALRAIAHLPGMPIEATAMLLDLVGEDEAARAENGGRGGLSSTERSRKRRAEMQRQIPLHATEMQRDATGNATADATGNATAVAPPDPPEISHSFSVNSGPSEKIEREIRRARNGHATEMQRDATGNATDATGARNGQRFVRRTDALDAELTAIAELAGVQDIPRAWAKFTGKHADQWLHVSGQWQSWCQNVPKFERLDRERERQSVERGSGTVRTVASRDITPGQSKRKPLTAEQALETVKLADPALYERTMAKRKGVSGGT
jgi:hypothetical protein